MPPGAAAGPSAQSVLPPALVLAQRELSAARFLSARAAAAPLFLQARDSSDWRLTAEAALVMARASGNLREGAEALRWAHEALQAGTLAGRTNLICASWLEMAREHAREEQGALAQRAVDEVLARVAGLTEPDDIESAYSGLTVVYSELGLTHLAVSCARHALEYALTGGDLPRISMARTNFLIIAGVACEQAQEPDPEGMQRLLSELQPHLRCLHQEVPPLGSMLAEARLLRVTGSLATCEGRWEEARQAYLALTALARDGSALLPAQLACSAWIELGLAQRRLGLHDQALASGRRAEALNPVPDAPRRWVDLRRLSLIKDLTGDPQEALVLLRRSHDRRHHIVMSALESRAVALSVRLDEQTLRVENEGLRRSNANLRASVAGITRLAATDPLTGLLNRRGLQEVWAELEGMPGHRRVLGMVDVDHFKRVNDAYSHLVGDAVLRQIASLMGHELRGDDRLARFGGEEFAVVLLYWEAEAVRGVFERLRRVVQAFDWSRVEAGLQVTISAGVVLVERGESFDRAAARADRLLYAAKAAGRNRVLDDLGAASA